MAQPGSSAASPPQIEIRARGDFVDWLAAAEGALAVTTYNSGKLAIFSAPQGRLEARIWRLPRPMGLAYNKGRLAVATREQIWEWRADCNLFGIGFRHDTGRIDVHELAFDARGLCFANTRFNCLARTSSRANYRCTWTPPFITERVPADCCHLNGVGVRDGRVEMMTAFCAGAEPSGWRHGDRFTSGILIDVPSGRIAARGLCLPHSPRWHDGRWWFCNSGQGTLATLDGHRGACSSVAALPGFTRGLCFANGRAAVGLSRIRKEHILDAPPVRERFAKLRSGIWLIELTSGQATGALEFVRGGREVFDIAFLPGICVPALEFDASAPKNR